MNIAEQNMYNDPRSTSWETVANKYLSEKVKSFIKWEGEFEESLDRYELEGFLTIVRQPAERDDLKTAFISKTVKGEIKEEDVKKFCESINKCAEQGIIEYGIITPVFSVNFNNGIQCLYLYTFSKYGLADQKKLGDKYFIEGEL